MPQIKGVKVTPSQAAVYEVLDLYGPMADHALVPLAQHMASIHQSSSGIRSRRAELTKKNLIEPFGAVTTGSGRSATVWAVK